MQTRSLWRLSTLTSTLSILAGLGYGMANASANHAEGPTPEIITDARSQAMTPRFALKALGAFKPSFYWIALEKNDGTPRNTNLLDENGNILATVSAAFAKELKMEGTGRLLDGRVINYKSRLKKPDGSIEIRYRICGPEAPFGYGFEDIPLIPFRTLAVDTKVVPIGSKMYVPAAKGAILPDSSVHDGFFYALDIGDAIKNKRIDVFTSFGDQSSVFRAVGMNHMKPVEVYLVAE